MNGSCLSRYFLRAYSIFVLLLPWTTYAAASDPGPTEREQNMACDAMAQPAFWQQKESSVETETLSGSQRNNANKPDADKVAVDGIPSAARAPRICASHLNAPCIHIRQPSWRGLVPYNIPHNIPPPICLPA